MALSPYAASPVQADGTVQWTVAPSVAFYILPMKGNRGGFPLNVVLDPDGAARSMTVEGPDGEPGGVPFTKVRITGAFPNDKYILFTAESETDRRRVEFRTDREGYLAMRTAPPVELFSLIICCGPGGALTGRVYINPGPRDPAADPVGTLEYFGVTVGLPSAGGDPWDLSGFTGFRLVAEITNDWPATTFKPFVELVPTNSILDLSYLPWSPTTFQNSAERIYMGSNGNLGTGSGHRYGSIQLGAGAELSDVMNTATARRSPLIRVGVDVSGGTFPDNGYAGGWSSTQTDFLRLTAVAY